MEKSGYIGLDSSMAAKVKEITNYMSIYNALVLKLVFNKRIILRNDNFVEKRVDYVKVEYDNVEFEFYGYRSDKSRGGRGFELNFQESKRSASRVIREMIEAAGGAEFELI